MPDKTPIPLSRVVLRSAAVSLGALGCSTSMRLDAIGLLAVLFSVGFLAGAFGRRQGWLSGIIAGFPLSFHQVTRMTHNELGRGLLFLSHPDYWRIVAPAAVTAAGMAVLGSMTGAWLQDMQLQKEG